MKRLPLTHPCQFLKVASFPDYAKSISIPKSKNGRFFFLLLSRVPSNPNYSQISSIEGLSRLVFKVYFEVACRDKFLPNGVPSKEAEIVPFLFFFLFLLLLKYTLCCHRSLSAFSCLGLESAMPFFFIVCQI